MIKFSSCNTNKYNTPFNNLDRLLLSVHKKTLDFEKSICSRGKIKHSLCVIKNRCLMIIVCDF
jgi:hypothetical protein